MKTFILYLLVFLHTHSFSGILNFRQKLGGGNQNESVLVQNLANGLALEFECSDPTRRLRLLLSELLLVMAQVRSCVLVSVRVICQYTCRKSTILI